MVLGVALLLYFDVLRVSPGSGTLLALAAGLAASLNAAVPTWLGCPAGEEPAGEVLERRLLLGGHSVLSALARPFTTANQPPKSCAE